MKKLGFQEHGSGGEVISLAGNHCGGFDISGCIGYEGC